MSQYAKEEPKPRVLQTLRVYTDAELAALDKELQTTFNGLRTKRDLERFWVRDGAGSFKDGVFHRNPSTFDATDHKLAQWARWRGRKFPFDQRVAYEQWADQRP